MTLWRLDNTAHTFLGVKNTASKFLNPSGLIERLKSKPTHSATKTGSIVPAPVKGQKSLNPITAKIKLQREMQGINCSL